MNTTVTENLSHIAETKPHLAFYMSSGDRQQVQGNTARQRNTVTVWLAFALNTHLMAQKCTVHADFGHPML